MRVPDGRAPLVLHVFPSFAVGGAQVRFASLANRFGDRWRHAVVALDGCTASLVRIAPGVPLACLPAPVRPGEGIARLGRIRGMLRTLSPAVLVTSNWGSMEWAVVSRTLPGLRHVHTEDGFGPDEVGGQKLRRVLARRLILRQSKVALPSLSLLRIAREVWRLPERALNYIPNGIDLARFSPGRQRAQIPGLCNEGPVIGTVATLRPEKNLPRLLRSFALLRRQGIACQLLLVGDGPELPVLRGLAAELGVEASVLFAGRLADPAAAYRAMDVFALSSDTEQMPFSILEAMASGLAVAATEVGDVRHMLSEPNAPFLASRDDAALADTMRRLIADPDLRARLGGANRARAEQAYDEEAMFHAYAALIDGGR